MPFSTYNELQAAVVNFAVRPDLSGQVPDFIRLAEIRVQQELGLQLAEKVATGTLTPGSEVLALPADWVAPRLFRLDTTPVRVLTATSYAELQNIYAADDGDGPRWYAYRGLNLWLAPKPVDATPYTLFYDGGVPKLSSDEPTNTLLAQYPNLLLYGALLELAMEIKDDAAATKWVTAFDRAKVVIAERTWHARFAGGPLMVTGDNVV